MVGVQRANDPAGISERLIGTAVSRDHEMRSCPACHASAARPFAEKNTHAIVQCAHCATLYTIDGIERAYDGAYATEYERAPFLAKRLDDIVAAFGPARRNG